MSFDTAEADRRISQSIQIGTVTDINAAAAKAVVEIGDIGTHEIAVMQLRAGALSFWWMPEAGEQVLIVAPSGDMARAVIVGSIYAGNAPSGDAGTPMIDLAGGTMNINGTLTVTGDVIASGVSLVNHTHGGVQSGGANTGAPN